MRHTIHTEVDKQTKAALIKAAKDQRVSLSVVIRWALLAYLEAKSKEQAAA